MAYQVSGRTPAPGSEGRRLAEVERAVTQLQRGMGKKQKIPQAAPVTGGVPIGGCELRASSSSLNYQSLSLRYQDVTWQAPTDLWPDLPGIVPASQWVDASGSDVVLAEGWYEASVFGDLGWPSGSAPSTVRPLAFWSPDPPMALNAESARHTVTEGSNAGFRDHLHGGLVHTDGSGYVRFEMTWPDAGLGTGAFVGLTGSPSLIWTFKKLT